MLDAGELQRKLQVRPIPLHGIQGAAYMGCRDGIELRVTALVGTQHVGRRPEAHDRLEDVWIARIDQAPPPGRRRQ
jgi:hypothetical protein